MSKKQSSKSARKGQGAKSARKSPPKQKVKRNRANKPRRVKSLASGKTKPLKHLKIRPVKSIAGKTRKSRKRKSTLGGFISRNFKREAPPPPKKNSYKPVSEAHLDSALDFLREQTGLNIPANMSRLRKLETILGFKEVMHGRRKVVKVTPEKYKQWKQSGIKDVTFLPNNRVIIPSEPGFTETDVVEQDDKILGGAIRQKVPLKRGEAEIVNLPVHINSIDSFERWVDSHPELDRLKFENENWGFIIGDGTIEGSNVGGFRVASLSEMKQILMGYRNAVNPVRAPEFFAALRLVRVKGPGPLEDRKKEQAEIWRERERARDRARSKIRYAKKRKERGG